MNPQERSVSDYGVIGWLREAEWENVSQKPHSPQGREEDAAERRRKEYRAEEREEDLFAEEVKKKSKSGFGIPRLRVESEGLLRCHSME